MTEVYSDFTKYSFRCTNKCICKTEKTFSLSTPVKKEEQRSSSVFGGGFPG